MLPKAFGTFVHQNDNIYRTEASLVWGKGDNNLGLVIMLNPGSSKLADSSIWTKLESKVVDCATGELVLDDTMEALAVILQASHPVLDGTLHIRNLFNVRNSNSEDALELYKRHALKQIHLDENLLHTNFESLLVDTDGYKNVTCSANPWVWLGWTVEDDRFLNRRKREVWNICQKLPGHVHHFAIYSRAERHRKSGMNIHTYHPCPQNPNDKERYKNEMTEQMRKYFNVSRVQIVAESPDSFYVILKWGSKYALTKKGVHADQVHWEPSDWILQSALSKGNYEELVTPIEYGF